MSDVKHYMKTEEEWLGYTRESAGSGFLDYLEANKEFTQTLEEKLQQYNSFEELKAELLALCQDRRNFIDYAQEHVP